MLRPKLEVADIFRLHGEAWRVANAGRLSLAQRRVMTAIEICRTAALGGHVERCQDCAHTLERLGIAEELKAKTKFPPAGGFVGKLLVNEEVDIAVQQLSELMSVSGTEVVGPLPSGFQSITVLRGRHSHKHQGAGCRKGAG